jgi:hypothetical protein
MIARLRRWSSREHGDHGGTMRMENYTEVEGAAVVVFEMVVVHPGSSAGRSVSLMLNDRDARELMAKCKEFLIWNRSKHEGQETVR